MGEEWRGVERSIDKRTDVEEKDERERKRKRRRKEEAVGQITGASRGCHGVRLRRSGFGRIGIVDAGV